MIALCVGICYVRAANALNFIEQGKVVQHGLTQLGPVLPTPARNHVVDGGEGQALVVKVPMEHVRRVTEWYGGLLVVASKSSNHSEFKRDMRHCFRIDLRLIWAFQLRNRLRANFEIAYALTLKPLTRQGQGYPKASYCVGHQHRQIQPSVYRPLA